MADTHSEAVSAVEKLENAGLLALSKTRAVGERSRAAQIITKCYAPSFRALYKERDKRIEKLRADANREAERYDKASRLLGRLVLLSHSAATSLTGMAKIMVTLGYEDDAKIMLKNAELIEDVRAAAKEGGVVGWGIGIRP